jgi:cell division protein FtsI/penicillin-binding protein 2
LRGSNDEDEAQEKVNGEDIARLDGYERHEANSEETVKGIEALSRSEDIGYSDVSKMIAGKEFLGKGLQPVNEDLPASSQK